MSVLLFTLAASCFVVQGHMTCSSSTGCRSSDVAILPPANQAMNQYFYIGGMFGVHEQGSDAKTCGAVRERGFQNMMMMFWTIRTFNSRRDYGTRPQVSVGAIAFDSCSRQEKTIENIVSFETGKISYGRQIDGAIVIVQPKDVLAYVGPDRSSEAMLTGELLRDLSRTQVSHAASSSQLDRPDVYSYFLRTVPSDENDVNGIIAVLDNQNWAYVIVVYTDNVFGAALYSKFKEKAERSGIFIVLTEKISREPNQDEMDTLVSRAVEKELAYAVVVLSDAYNAKILLDAFEREVPNVRGKFGFIGLSSWGDTKSVVSDSGTIAHGALTFRLANDVQRYVDNFKTWFMNLTPWKTNEASVTGNPWFNNYWEKRLGCKLSGIGGANCSETDNLPPTDMDVYLANTFVATEAVLAGVEEARVQVCTTTGTPGGVCTRLTNVDSEGGRIYQEISTVELNGRRVFNSSNGPMAWRYDVLSWSPDSGIAGGSYLKVGEYSSEGLRWMPDVNKLLFYLPDGTSVSSRESLCPPNSGCTPIASTDPPTTARSTTPRDVTDGGRYVQITVQTGMELTGVGRLEPRSESEYGTRFDLGYNWIIALGVLAGLGILAVIVFEIHIMYLLLPDKENRQFRTMWLGQLLLFGIFLSYLTLFAFMPIPTKATCGIIRFGVGTSYGICFSVLLVKLMVILASRPPSAHYISGDEGSNNYLKGSYQFLLFMFCLGVQLVINIQWLIQVPPEAVKVTTIGGQKAWVCNHYTWSTAIVDGDIIVASFVRTAFENHLISLTYMMALILVVTFIALKAHGIITNHRESVFIGIAAGFSIPIWLAWALVGGLNKDKSEAHEYGDASIAFGLFIVATLMLFAMFLPKVRKLVNMGVEGVYLEDDRETVYGGSVYGGAPPSYKSKTASGPMLYVNNSGIYSEPVVPLSVVPSQIYSVHSQNGGYNTGSLHLKHPGSKSVSVYSAPSNINFVRRPDSMYSTVGTANGTKVLRVTGDLTGKYPSEQRRPRSEAGYNTVRSSRSEVSVRSIKSGNMRRSRSSQELGAL